MDSLNNTSAFDTTIEQTATFSTSFNDSGVLNTEQNPNSCSTPCGVTKSKLGKRKISLPQVIHCKFAKLNAGLKNADEAKCLQIHGNLSGSQLPKATDITVDQTPVQLSELDFITLDETYNLTDTISNTVVESSSLREKSCLEDDDETLLIPSSDDDEEEKENIENYYYLLDSPPRHSEVENCRLISVGASDVMDSTFSNFQPQVASTVVVAKHFSEQPNLKSCKKEFTARSNKQKYQHENLTIRIEMKRKVPRSETLKIYLNRQKNNKQVAYPKYLEEYKKTCHGIELIELMNSIYLPAPGVAASQSLSVQNYRKALQFCSRNPDVLKNKNASHGSFYDMATECSFKRFAT